MGNKTFPAHPPLLHLSVYTQPSLKHSDERWDDYAYTNNPQKQYTRGSRVHAGQDHPRRVGYPL